MGRDPGVTRFDGRLSFSGSCIVGATLAVALLSPTLLMQPFSPSAYQHAPPGPPVSRALSRRPLASPLTQRPRSPVCPGDEQSLAAPGQSPCRAGLILC